MKKRASSLCIIALVGLCCVAVPASAEMYGFFPITNNSADPTGVAEQLSLEVTKVGSEVRFKFSNDGPIESFIAQAFFDDAAGTLNAMLEPIDGTGVDFVVDPSPDKLPGGHGAPYHFTTDFEAEADHLGLNKDGVDIHENVTVPFSLSGGVHFSDIIAALDAGVWNPTNTANTLRIGIHVQGLPNAAGAPAESDAFMLIHTPVPAAAILGMLGLSVAGWRLRRFA